MAESKPKALVVDFNNLWNKYLYSRGGNFTNAIYATLYFFRDLYNSKEFQRVYIVLDGKPDKGYEIYSIEGGYRSYLRKKLAALRADIQIRATRNTGYSLEELR